MMYVWGGFDMNDFSAVERRLRICTRAIQKQRKAEEEHDASMRPNDVYPYIAISREVGAGGSRLAQRLSNLLGWETLDRQLLDQMAERYWTPRTFLEQVDERAANWFEEIFGKWFNPQVVTQSEYIVKLHQFVCLVAKSRSCVFVGRGCHLLLPSEGGLSVFVTAPYAMRVEQTRASRHCSREEAARHVDEADRQRKKFYIQHFHKEMGDIQHHDFAINLRHTTVDDGARLLAGEVH
jgi:hypothetical protein